MNPKFEINPFDRSALTDIRLLAARTNELRQIRFVLRNAFKHTNRVKSILVSGDRGVGKTSLLNLISQECLTNNILPIRLNLTETNCINSNEFFWHLFSQTINAIFKLGLLGGKGGEVDEAIQKVLIGDGLSDIANWIFRTPILRKSYLMNQDIAFDFDLLVHDLSLIRDGFTELKNQAVNEKTKFLYLVDESQYLYTKRRTIEEIRYIIQNHDLGIGFVFAGDKSYKASEWEGVFGGSHREFEIVSLDYFVDSNAVEEYFRKSLQTIGWTTEEIEETLFYRFKQACRQIFTLTSGKPSWINTIAMKMFERCMRGETRELRFDNQAKGDVKQLLEESGLLDKNQVELINNLGSKYEKWISLIFACEISQLKNIYFFGKLMLLGDNSMSLKEFESFCLKLLNNGIIQIVGKDEKKDIELLEKRYYCFGVEADTIKQWLQISSSGRFKFQGATPEIKYAEYISDELKTDNGEITILASKSKMEEAESLSDFLLEINSSTFDAMERSLHVLSYIYKSCKKLDNSRERNVLFIQLYNEETSVVYTWNVYSCNEKNKIIEYYTSEHRIGKLINNVKVYYNSDHPFSLTVQIQKFDKPNLSQLQSAIINTGDSKKIGIIVDDKSEDLVRQYVKEKDMKTSKSIAEFFFQLFSDGFDLHLKELNNAAYVFLTSENLEVALQLLKEAERKIKLLSYGNDELWAVGLVYYNLGILFSKLKQYNKAVEMFTGLKTFCKEKEVTDISAAALLKITVNDNGDISFVEEKNENLNLNELQYLDLAEENISLLSKFL